MNCVHSLFGRACIVALVGLGLPLSLLGSAHLLAKSYERVKLADQTIQVKGFAEKAITADLATWSAQVSARALTQAEAYRALSRDMARVQAYLEKSGVPGNELVIGAVHSSPVYQMAANGMTTNVIESFVLSQDISLRSGDIARIASLANQATSLLEEGIDISSNPPQFFYTKINDLKLEMLGAASRDARARAEQLAENSGGEVGSLRSAQQGVFQITPENSTDVSDYGSNDTSAIHKSIKAVVTVEYSLVVE
jgi:hypothetical protein